MEVYIIINKNEDKMYKKIEIYKYTEVYIVINKIKITCINKINIYIYIYISKY